MAMASKLFLIIFLFPSLEAALQEPHQNTGQAMQAMITRACADAEDQTSCLSNIQSRLPKYDRLQNVTSVLAAAIEATIDQAQLAIGSVTRFASLSSSSSREQIAIEDCKELLDFTVTELGWSLGEMRKLRSSPVAGNNRRGRRSREEDLKAWLSAALGNQDTCLEGFEGTNRHVENNIKGSLKQVSQLVNNVLTLYTQMHSLPFRVPRSSNNGTGKNNESPDYPKWLTDGDKELLVSSQKGMHVDAVVSLDESGKYRSISEAIFEAPSYSNRRYVIYVNKGVYHENIDMKKKKTNIMLVGDGIGETVISGSRNFMQGWTTFRTPTVAVSGKGFIARGITFRNTAGPHTAQAVALRVDSDQSAFYQCSMEGYQDTLYSHSLRQFYRDCNIYGTIDFLFGNGAAVFQNCNIYTRVPLPLQKVTVAAQGRKSPDQSTGFIIQDSFVYATQPTYLGRPWKLFSRVVYLNTYMSQMVQPRGWLEWYGSFALGTLYFGEYRNYGPGSSLSGRVRWPGYHIIQDPSTASYFTVGRFIDGMSWLPATGVKFSAGALCRCRRRFQASFNKIGRLDINYVDKMISNLKIWLSATITYQETCIDGFENATGNAGEKVRNLLKTAMELSSNGLAITSHAHALCCRDVIPSWLDEPQWKLHRTQMPEAVEPNVVVTEDGTGKFKNKAYLARPWKVCSKMIIMEFYLEDLIDSDGWLPWMETSELSACHYGEYNNAGPGANMIGNVKWHDAKTITSTCANKYIPSIFLGCDE
ncbi:hypothetical protein Nepgr_001590 [Nepenthes gracilis]|uniref:Pectinesterase inhibitor domain-containing protein n=1 Tax=Nepenthes gracilis TaxID=150966 RepID=A0AAD3RXL1_NEPGR|nr:hypothetical protein Nepgr_001590 [Nepenthes gracilis]